MRLRFAVLASGLTAFAAVVAPAAVSAAPHHNRGLTISAMPNPIIAGGGVFIHGQLRDTPVAGQTISLYHRVNPARHFTLIGTTTTHSFGFYLFTREEGVVYSNRSWFVRGPSNSHSRTIHERVAALVGIAANKTTSDTNHPVTFSGHVTPNHAFERVFLQQQIASSGDDWKTIGSDRLGPGSNYVISHTWRRPGEDGPGVHDLRVVFGGDRRNIRSESDIVTVAIQQRQVPGFTIKTSAPIIPEGASVTISGVLDTPGTTTPEGMTVVTLYGHTDGQAYRPIGTPVITASNGSYSFPLTGLLAAPTHNEVYQVRTTLFPFRHTAQLFEGVRDVVSTPVTPTTSTVGGQVTFTGTVKPDKAGHLIYLQRKGVDGDWHNVDVSVVNSLSGYSFTHTFGEPGTKMFRVRIYGGPENVGGASSPVTISVTGVAPLSTLPPAS